MECFLMPISLDQIRYGNLLEQIKEQNNNINSSNGSSSTSGSNGGITLNSLRQLQQSRQKEKQEDTDDDIDLTGKRQLNAAESALAGLKGVGDSLMEATGFGEKWQHVKDEAAEGHLDIGDIADAVPNFLASVPAGMVAGLTEAPAFLAEAVSGNDITQAEQDKNGNWYGSDNELTLEQRVGSGVYGAMDLVGIPFLGGSKTALKGAGKAVGAWLGREATEEAAERGVAKAVKELGKDAATEGLEEGVQTAFEYMRGDENGSQTEKIFSEEGISSMLESAGLGAAGGAVMHGAGKLANKAASLLSTEGRETNSEQQQEENAALAPLHSLREMTQNDYVLTPVKEEMAETTVGEDAIPGVATATLAPGQIDLGIDEMAASREQIRKMTNNRDTLDALYNALVVDDVSRQQYPTAEDFAYMINHASNAQVVANLNTLITNRDAINDPIYICAWKEPNTNDSPFKFRLRKIVDNDSQCAFLNPYVHGSFNMDVDGDKIKISFLKKDLDSSTYASHSIYNRETNTSPAKKNYLNLDQSTEGIVAARNWISNNIRRDRNVALNNLSSYSNDAYNLTDVVRMAFTGSDADFARFIIALIRDMEESGLSELDASRLVSQFLQASKLKRYEAALANIEETQRRNDEFAAPLVSGGVDIESEQRVPLEQVHARTNDVKNALTNERYALEIASILGFKIDMNQTQDNPVFRLCQALGLEWKEQKTATIMHSLYNTFFAHKAMLTALGEKPENTIESIFTESVLSATRSELIYNSAWNKANYITDRDSVVAFEEAFRKSWNTCVEQYNKAIQSHTMQGSTLLYGISEKQKIKEGDDTALYTEIARAVKDYDCSFFFGEHSQYQGYSIQELMNMIFERTYDDGRYTDYGNVNHETYDYFISKLFKQYESARYSLEKKIETNIDNIVECGPSFSDNVNNVRADDYVDFASSIVRIIGVKSCMRLNLNTLQNLMAYGAEQGEEIGPYWRMLTSGDSEQIKNAILTISVQGQFFQARALFRNNNIHDVDEMLRILAPLCNYSPVHRQLALEYYSMYRDQVDPSNSLVEQFCDPNVIFSAKSEMHENVYLGQKKTPPVLAMLALGSDSDIALQTAMQQNKLAESELTRAAKNYNQKIQDDLTKIIQYKRDNVSDQILLIDYFRDRWRNYWEVDSSILANAVYGAGLTTTNDMIEKGKNTESAAQLYISLAERFDGGVYSWQETVFSHANNVWNIKNVLSNRLVLGEIIFENKEITCYDESQDGVTILNATAIYEAATHNVRRNRNVPLTETEFIELIQTVPSLATMFSSHIIQSNETAQGVKTESKRQHSLYDDFDEYLKERNDEEANYKRDLNVIKMMLMNSPQFYGSLGAINWWKLSPRQLAKEVRTRLEEEAQAIYSATSAKLTDGSFLANDRTSNKATELGLNSNTLFQRLLQYALEIEREVNGASKSMYTEHNSTEVFTSRDVPRFLNAQTIAADVFEGVVHNSAPGTVGIDSAILEFIRKPESLLGYIVDGVFHGMRDQLTDFAGDNTDAQEQLEHILLSLLGIQTINNGLWKTDEGQGMQQADAERMKEYINDLYDSYVANGQMTQAQKDEAYAEACRRINERLNNTQNRSRERSNSFINVYRSLCESLNRNSSIDLGRVEQILGVLGRDVLISENLSTEQNPPNEIVQQIVDFYNSLPNVNPLDFTPDEFRRSWSAFGNGIDGQNRRLRFIQGWNNRLRAQLIEEMFSIFTSKPNFSFADQLIALNDARIGWVNWFLDYVLQEGNEGLYNSITTNAANHPAVFKDVDFLNPLNANLAGRMMMEANSSNVSTLIGLDGNIAGQSGVLSALKATDPDPGSWIDLTQDWFDPGNGFIYDQNNDGAYVALSVSNIDELRMFGEPAYTTSDGRLCYVVNDNFRATINRISQTEDGARLLGNITAQLHDSAHCRHPETCKICGGSSHDAFGNPVNPVSNVTSSLVDIIRKIGIYAMEPRLLKAKKTFRMLCEIVRGHNDYDSVDVSIFRSNPNSSIVNTLPQVFADYNRLRRDFARILQRNARDLLDDDILSQREFDLLCDCLTNTVKVNYGSGLFCFVRADALDDLDTLANALISQIGGTRDNVLNGIESIDLNIWSITQLESKVTNRVVDRMENNISNHQVSSSEEISSWALEGLYDLSAYSNFRFGDDGRMLISDAYNNRINGYLHRIRPANMAINKAGIVLEDDPTRVQKWISDENGTIREYENDSLVICDQKKIEEKEGISRLFIKNLLVGKGFNLQKHLISNATFVSNGNFDDRITASNERAARRYYENSDSEFNDAKTCTEIGFGKVQPFKTNDKNGVTKRSAELVIALHENAASKFKYKKYISTKLLSGQSVIVNKSVYDSLKSLYEFDNIMSKIGKSEYWLIEPNDYLDKINHFGAPMPCGVYGCETDKAMSTVVSNLGLSDSGKMIRQDSMHKIVMYAEENIDIDLSKYKQNNFDNSRIHFLNYRELQSLSRRNFDNIQIDVSKYKKTKHEDLARGAMQELLTNIRFNNGRVRQCGRLLSSPYSINEISSDSAIGVAVYYNDLNEPVYVPIMMPFDIPNNATASNVHIESNGKIKGVISGHYDYTEKNIAKFAERGMPYKTIAISNDPDNIASTDVVTMDENGQVISFGNFVGAWPRAAISAANIVFDSIIDKFSFLKRLAGNYQNILRMNLHVFSRYVGYNLFFQRSGDRFVPKNAELYTDAFRQMNNGNLIQTMQQMSVADTFDDLWVRFADGEFDIYNDNASNTLLRKVYSIACQHNLPIGEIIGSLIIKPPLSLETNGEMISGWADDGSVIPIHKNNTFDYKLIYSNLTDNEVLKLFNMFDERFCPPNTTTFLSNDIPEEVKNSYIFDNQGQMLVSSTERDGAPFKRTLVLWELPMPLDPRPGTLLGTTAREGMQYHNDVWLRRGFPNDYDDQLDWYTQVKLSHHRYDALGNLIHDEDERKLQRRRDNPESIHMTDEQMAQEYEAIDHLRMLPMYKNFHKKMEEISKKRRNRIKIGFEGKEGKETEYISPEDFKRCTNQIGQALGIDNINADIVLTLFEMSIGWDYSDDFKFVPTQVFKTWVQETSAAILADNNYSFNWIHTRPSGGRYPLALTDRHVIEYIAQYSQRYRNGLGCGVNYYETIRNRLNTIQEEIDREISIETDAKKKTHLQDLVDYFRLANDLEDQVYSNFMYGSSRWSDFSGCNEIILREMFGHDRDAYSRALDEMRRCDRIGRNLEKLYNNRNKRIYEDLPTNSERTANKRSGDKLFVKFLANANIISKAMSFLHPLMPVANMLDRATGTTVQTAMFRASMHGFGPYTSLRNAAQYVPRRSSIRFMTENPTVQKIWKAYQVAAFEGDALDMISNMKSETQIDEYLDSILNKDGKNKVEKAFSKIAYFSSGGQFFLNNQLENLVLAFVAKAYSSGQTYWFASNGQTDPNTGQPITNLEAMLIKNPTLFIRQMFDSKSPSFLIGQQSINLVKEGDKAQKNIVSIIYHELASRTTLGKFLFETGFCKFPQYMTNKIGNILGWIAPMSSLHHLAARTASQYRGQNETMLGIAAEAETIVSQSSLREAIAVDVTRMTAGFVAMALFGLAAFEPPDDDDKLYNIDEWTIFGYRISDEWWIADTLGLALPIAASWKLQFMGKPNIQLLVNGVAKVCYNNPAIRIADAVSCILNPDITLDDFIDEDKYENALGGAPAGLEWLSESWQSLGLSYLSQFFTPSFLREVYTDFNSYEVSTKRIYEEDATGHLTEDGTNGKTMVTDFSDQQLRKLCKNNPIIALAANAVLHPNTSYWAYEMPKTVYYDQNQMDSMNAYSLYNDDGTEKSDEQLDAMFCEIWSIMSSTDDMEELYDAGFYLDYETKAWMSKILYEMSSDLRNEYYERDANGEFDYYLLGDGDWSTGKKLAKEIQSAYWDDINMINDFYQNKLWSEPMRRSMQTYNRINTTYEQDANGDWYATGYRKQSIPFWPIMSADGTLTDAEGTAGYDQDWATLSAVNGQAMYDENGNGLRGLVAYEYDTMSVPDFDSWKDDDDDDSSSKNSSGSSSNSDDSTSTGYSRSYGSSGGGYSSGGSKVKFSSSPSRVTYDRSTTMDSSRPYDADFDYLRPSFTTKGSREAYRREDY